MVQLRCVQWDAQLEASDWSRAWFVTAGRVQVRPKHKPATVRYSFRVQSIRSVDPALPLARGGGGQMMHALEVPPVRVLQSEEVAAARREAARRVRLQRRSPCL